MELLARAFDVPLELSPLIEPSVSLVEQMSDGRLEGIVLKDRTSTYRDGSRAGWTKVKDRSGTSARRGGSIAVSRVLRASAAWLKSRLQSVFGRHTEGRGDVDAER